MGTPKSLLRIGSETFLRRILAVLRSADILETVVVVRPGQPAVLEEIRAAGYGRAIENRMPEQGQLSSLLLGLEAVVGPAVTGVLVTLVDVPLIEPATIRLLVARADQSRARILRAAYRGAHGHPVLFKRDVFDSLRHADAVAGAKSVVRANPVEDVEVDDPGVVRDFDTPEDYRGLANPSSSADA